MYVSGLAYSPYGFCAHLSSMLGFNGQRVDPATGGYLLGNGYRMFMPSLRRFNSPDSMSPFEAGGINAYAYCWGDPVNWQDVGGHTPSRPPRTRSLPARVVSDKTVEVVNLVRYDNVRSTKIKSVSPDAGIVPDDYNLIALHGSGAMHKASLEKGIDKRFLVRQKYGAAFYASPDYSVAAFFSQDFKREARLFGVYAKEVQGWVEGTDYSYARSGWLKILEPAFKKVLIREEIIMPIRVLDSSTPGVEPYQPYQERKAPRRPPERRRHRLR